MKIFGQEQTKRESIYLLLILIVLIGFFLNVWAQEKTIVGYHNALVDCENKIVEWNNGNNMNNVWGNMPNTTLNITGLR